MKKIKEFLRLEFSEHISKLNQQLSLDILGGEEGVIVGKLVLFHILECLDHFQKGFFLTLTFHTEHFC
jgi:hypothetical protein